MQQVQRPPDDRNVPNTEGHTEPITRQLLNELNEDSPTQPCVSVCDGVTVCIKVCVCVYYCYFVSLCVLVC